MHRKGKRQQASTPAPLKIEVVGTSCPIVKNDTLAKFIHEGQHLIPWNEKDTSRLIERYDARNFFDSESSFVYDKRKRKLSAFPTDMEDKALNDERFYDLLHQEENNEPEFEEENQEKTPETEKKGVFHAVGFSYEPAIKEEAAKVETPEAPFSPPFPVPSSIKVPPQKLHDIILRTADFTIKQGPNAEFILKLKQSKNPNFAFFELGSEYHPYYNYLKEKHSSISEFMELKLPENKQLDALLDESVEESKKSENFTSSSTENSASSVIDSPTSENSGVKLVDYESEEEEIQQPLIEPPADIKQVMEKLIAYVKKSGKSFEAEIRKREAFNPRFQFLNPLHMYHPYYLQLLSGNSPKISTSKTSKFESKKVVSSDSQIKDLRLKKAKLVMEMIKEK